MDIAAELRASMASKQVTVADVAKLVGRTPVQVSRYRNGHTAIPLDVAQVLHREGLLSAEMVLGTDAA